MLDLVILAEVEPEQKPVEEQTLADEIRQRRAGWAREVARKYK